MCTETSQVTHILSGLYAQNWTHSGEHGCSGTLSVAGWDEATILASGRGRGDNGNGGCRGCDIQSATDFDSTACGLGTKRKSSAWANVGDVAGCRLHGIVLIPSPLLRHYGDKALWCRCEYHRRGQGQHEPCYTVHVTLKSTKGPGRNGRVAYDSGEP